MDPMGKGILFSSKNISPCSGNCILRNCFAAARVGDNFTLFFDQQMLWSTAVGEQPLFGQPSPTGSRQKKRVFNNTGL